MLFLSFLSWWYGRGWAEVATSIPARAKATAEAFSAGQLLRTLFAPWRRIISYSGRSVEDRFRAWLDNFFSRIVGFMVRFLVLLAALVIIVLTVLFTVVEILLWPLLPIAVPGCLIAGALL